MQGEVYRQIIDKVILQAQTDFEEGGYTLETLQELKLVSGKRLPRTSRGQQPGIYLSSCLALKGRQCG